MVRRLFTGIGNGRGDRQVSGERTAFMRQVVKDLPECDRKSDCHGAGADEPIHRAALGGLLINDGGGIRWGRTAGQCAALVGTRRIPVP